MSSSTTTPGAPSVPPPSADSRSSCDGLRPEPWHDRSPRRTATACGVPARPSGQICHEGAQAHTAALELAALMRIVKQVRATFGDALWADFVTHANARYTSTPSYVPSVALLSVALIGLNVNRLRYPIRSVAQLLYKSEYISHMQCAVRTRAPGPASRPRRASANQPLLARRRQSSSTRTSRSADGRMRVG